MSLYGALFAGVAGLKSQSNKLGVISDNVANVNTVGYKKGTGGFETLVTTAASVSAYSPGGVLGSNRLSVGKQGLLQATDSATDVAVSGIGMFVVNQAPDGKGQVSYTRAGSFRADQTGNYRNAAGFYLMAWPLDREGRLPGEMGNTNTTSNANIASLQVVNVQNITGVAAATTTVAVGANLNSSQSVFPGTAGKITMDSRNSRNFGIPAKTLIVPDVTTNGINVNSGTPINGIRRGDKLEITTGGGLNFSYSYGGFTFGRLITDGTKGDSGTSLLTNSTTLASNPITLTTGSNVVRITQVGHGLVSGDVVTLSGNTLAIGGIPADDFNGKFVVTKIDADNFTVKVASSAAATTLLTTTPMYVSAFNAGTSTATVRVSLTSTSGYSVGQKLTIANATAFDHILASEINGSRTISAVGANYLEFTTVATGSPVTLGATPIQVQAYNVGTGVATVEVAITGASTKYAVNDSIKFANATAIDSVPAGQINGTKTITNVGANYIRFTTTLVAESLTTNNPITTLATGVNPSFTIDMSGSAQTYAATDVVTLAGIGTINGVNFNGQFTVASVSGVVPNQLVTFVATGQTSTGVATNVGGSSGTVIRNPTTAVAGGNTGGTATATEIPSVGAGFNGGNTSSNATVQMATGGSTTINSITRPYAGYILDATNPDARFLGITGTSGFTTDSRSFTIDTAATGPLKFTYTDASPSTTQRQFNSLATLSEAINQVSGLSARVVDNRLFVGSTDANAGISFSNGGVAGTNGPPVQAGIDWVRELGLQDVASGNNRFSSLQGLYNLAAADAGISASIENPLGAAQLSIFADDPLDTITFADSPTKAALAVTFSATPFITTAGSSTVKVTHPSTHAFKTGDVVKLDSAILAAASPVLSSSTAISTTGSGVTPPVVTVSVAGSGYTFVAGDKITVTGSTSPLNGVAINGTYTITAVSGTAPNQTVSYESTGTSTGTTAGGGAAVTVAHATLGGIPIAEFSGFYDITVTSPTAYTVNLTTKATLSGATGELGFVVTPHNNAGSMAAELGLVPSLNGGTYTPKATTALGPAYSPTDATLNMAGGKIAAQFSRPVRIYDAQGTGHDLNLSFLKTGLNTWAVEAYAATKSEVISALPSGLLAYGNVSFNGDGTLRSVDNTLSQAIDITWTNGSTASSVTFNWGTAGQPFGTVGATTIGKSDGLGQFNADYKVNFVNQNGAQVGELTGVSISELGVIVASYSNGETQNLYKIPLADFANPDQLESTSGNVFNQSANSGELNLRQAGTSGVGKIAASSLEASNTELSEELTDMIVAQRSYQANAKVISTSDNMLEELNQIIR